MLSAESLSGRLKGQTSSTGKNIEKADEAPSWVRWRKEADATLKKEKRTRELKREARGVMIKRGLQLPPGWEDSEDFQTSDIGDDTEVDELEAALEAHEKEQRDRFQRLSSRKAYRAKVLLKSSAIPWERMIRRHQDESDRLVWTLPRV